MDAIGKAFVASGHDLRALMLAIVESRAWRLRAPSPGEMP
jgi:hypothetical protein